MKFCRRILGLIRHLGGSWVTECEVLQTDLRIDKATTGSPRRSGSMKETMPTKVEKISPAWVRRTLRGSARAAFYFVRSLRGLYPSCDHSKESKRKFKHSGYLIVNIFSIHSFAVFRREFHRHKCASKQLFIIFSYRISCGCPRSQTVLVS